MQPSVEVFYDGACPLCAREIRFLRARAHSDAVAFTDIAAPGFDAVKLGLNHAELMSELHVRRLDGTLSVGVEAFRQLYAALGFSRLVAVSRWAPMNALLRTSYQLFARNRLRLTGRCDSQHCNIQEENPT